MQAAESSKISVEGGEDGEEEVTLQEEGEEVRSKLVQSQDQQQCLICMVGTCVQCHQGQEATYNIRGCLRINFMLVSTV